MTLVYADSVKETTSNQSAGSGTAHNLSGAVTGFQTLVSGIGDGNSGVFLAEEVDADGNPAGAWEQFVGAVTNGSPDTLSRDYLIRSSTGSFIDWSTVGSSPEISTVSPSDYQRPYQYVPESVPDGSTEIWMGPPFHNAVSSLNTDFFRVEYFWMPVYISAPCLLTGMRFEVTSSATGENARMAVWEPVSQLTPKGAALIKEGTSQSIGSTGIKTDTFTGVLLMPGLKYLTLIGSVANGQFSSFGNSNDASSGLPAVYGHESGTFNSIASAPTISGTYPSGGHPSNLGTTVAAMRNVYPFLQIRVENV